MVKLKKPVERAKLLALVALMSNYDLFSVTTDRGMKFGATGINIKQDDFLMFERQFAKPIYITEWITDIHAKSDTEFVCTGENIIYTISALHKKPEVIATHIDRQYCDLVDLMDVNYFGNRLTTYIKELDTMILVVDPYCLGELTAQESAQIEKIINVNLGGLGRSMQMCRTACFQVRMNDGKQRIYAGIFDLENEVSVTSDLLYEDSMKDLVSDVFYNKCMDILAYAATVYKEGNFV